jgi:hypothetical protein
MDTIMFVLLVAAAVVLPLLGLLTYEVGGPVQTC